MTIDPVWRFIISIAVTTAIAISQGTLVLTNAVPVDLIKPITAWCGILAFIGSSINTAISGAGMGTQARIAGAASLPEVKAIVTTTEVAKASPSEKVVS